MPMNFADDEIETILRSYRLETLHASDDVIYALRPDLTLVYMNRGWGKFASANGHHEELLGKWPLGRSIREVIPESLQQFFDERYAHCLETGSPWQHRYECSSPDQYREFLMTTYPLGTRQGLLVINSLCHVASHDRTPQIPIEGQYRNSDGMIVQCAHCRRHRRTTGFASWDWVPQWLESLPDQVSHGLCEACFGYFYPNSYPRAGGYPKFVRTDHCAS